MLWRNQIEVQFQTTEKISKYAWFDVIFELELDSSK